MSRGLQVLFTREGRRFATLFVTEGGFFMAKRKKPQGNSRFRPEDDKSRSHRIPAESPLEIEESNDEKSSSVKRR